MSEKTKSRLYGIGEALLVFGSYLVIPSFIFTLISVLGIKDKMLAEVLLYVIYLIPLIFIYRKTFIEIYVKRKEIYEKKHCRYPCALLDPNSIIGLFLAALTILFALVAINV